MDLSKGEVDAARQVTDARQELRNGDAGDIREASEATKRAALERHLCAAAVRDAFRSVCHDEIEKLVSDLSSRLFPADPLPFPVTPFTYGLHGVQHTLATVHIFGVPQAFLAAARTIVRRISRSAIDSLLLLAPHYAVLDVDIEGAIASTIGAVGTVCDTIPCPLESIQIFERPVAWRGR